MLFGLGRRGGGDFVELIVTVRAREPQRVGAFFAQAFGGEGGLVGVGECDGFVFGQRDAVFDVLGLDLHIHGTHDV